MPGRPFLVGDLPRVAAIAGRGDWSSDLSPSLAGLEARERARLGEHWLEVALMEHASIAAFARFALDLLALGAPPDLVLSAQQAMADETAHARDAFALASAYLGRHVGPGRLDLGSPDERGLRDIVRTTALEGCIGETNAAAEAAEALAVATDPAVREALGRIVRDETRHAALAWRFLAWSLQSPNREVSSAAAAELTQLAAARASTGIAGANATRVSDRLSRLFIATALVTACSDNAPPRTNTPAAGGSVASHRSAASLSSSEVASIGHAGELQRPFRP